MEEILFSEGWERVKGWECLYLHREAQLFLSVYVDDFKMVGKVENMGPMWKTLKEKMELEPSTPLVDQVYLGCNQREADVDEELIATKADLFKRITTTSVNAGGDLEQLEDKTPSNVDQVVAARSSKPQDTTAWSYDMEGHAVQCVERYCELAHRTPESLKPTETPCIDDHQLKPEDFEVAGELASICARVVLKCLYLARIGRPDLLWTVNILARAVTKWTKACVEKKTRKT